MFQRHPSGAGYSVFFKLTASGVSHTLEHQRVSGTEHSAASDNQANEVKPPPPICARLGPLRSSAVGDVQTIQGGLDLKRASDL